MNAEAITYALLSADAALAALVGARVYPVETPIGCAMPAVAYRKISNTLAGKIDAYSPTHLMRARMQIDALADDYETVKSVAAAISVSMRFQRGIVAGVSVHCVQPAGEGPDMFDGTRGAFLQSTDFLVIYSA